MITEELFDGYSACCEIIPMGSDFTIAVYGGDTPHVGSVVMAIARPSLTGEGMGVTTSVLNKVGHKDEIIARAFAEAVAKEKSCTAVCSCGIHIDAITPEQLEKVQDASQRLLEKVLKSLG